MTHPFCTLFSSVLIGQLKIVLKNRSKVVDGFTRCPPDQIAVETVSQRRRKVNERTNERIARQRVSLIGSFIHFFLAEVSPRGLIVAINVNLTSGWMTSNVLLLIILITFLGLENTIESFQDAVIGQRDFIDEKQSAYFHDTDQHAVLPFSQQPGRVFVMTLRTRRLARTLPVSVVVSCWEWTSFRSEENNEFIRPSLSSRTNISRQSPWWTFGLRRETVGNCRIDLYSWRKVVANERDLSEWFNWIARQRQRRPFQIETFWRSNIVWMNTFKRRISVIDISSWWSFPTRSEEDCRSAVDATLQDLSISHDASLWSTDHLKRAIDPRTVNTCQFGQIRVFVLVHPAGHSLPVALN